MWGLPGSGIGLVFPALVVGFFSTEPPENSPSLLCSMQIDASRNSHFADCAEPAGSIECSPPQVALPGIDEQLVDTCESLHSDV